VRRGARRASVIVTLVRLARLARPARGVRLELAVEVLAEGLVRAWRRVLGRALGGHAGRGGGTLHGRRKTAVGHVIVPCA
jgi:hypothetical protein